MPTNSPRHHLTLFHHFHFSNSLQRLVVHSCDKELGHQCGPTLHFGRTGALDKRPSGFKYLHKLGPLHLPTPFRPFRLSHPTTESGCRCHLRLFYNLYCSLNCTCNPDLQSYAAVARHYLDDARTHLWHSRSMLHHIPRFLQCRADGRYDGACLVRIYPQAARYYA